MENNIGYLVAVLEAHGCIVNAVGKQGFIKLQHWTMDRPNHASLTVHYVRPTKAAVLEFIDNYWG